LVIVSFVFPTLCAIDDATFFSHLIPPEIQAALDQHVGADSKLSHRAD
jgi:hypothetical protein